MQIKKKKSADPSVAIESPKDPKGREGREGREGVKKPLQQISLLVRKISKARVIGPEKIFKEASEFVRDDFWKETILNMSKSIFPDEFKVEGLELKSSENSLKLTDDFEEMSEKIIIFMKEEGFLPVEEEESWSKITSSRKMHLIEKFIIDKSAEMNLEGEKLKMFETIIRIGFCSGKFNKKNIIVKNGIIDSIEDLTIIGSEYTLSEKFFKSSKPRVKSQAKKAPKKIKKNCVERWIEKNDLERYFN